MKQLIKQDLNNYLETEFERVIEENRNMKCLRPRQGQQRIICLKDNTDSATIDKDKIIHVTEHFYIHLYESKINKDSLDDLHSKFSFRNV